MKIFPKVLLAVVVLFGTADIAAAYPAAARVTVNMRAGPGPRFRLIGAVPRAAIVDVRTCQPNWCQVSYRGRVGYVARAYLQVRPAARPVPRRPLPPPPPRYDDPYDRYDPRDQYDPRDRYDPRDQYDPYDPRGGYNPPDNYPGPGPEPFVCLEDNTQWAIGRVATRANIDRVRDEANARMVRIVRPGMFYTQEYNDGRVNIEVDGRNIIVDIRCG